MIQLAIPGFPDFYDKYNKIDFYLARNTSRTQRLCFSDLGIECVYGNFPYVYFNGDININNDDNIITYRDYGNYVVGTSFPVRFMLSNIFLTEWDYKYDLRVKSILDYYCNMNYQIEISDLRIAQYYKDIYDYQYQYILSKNFFYENPINLEILEQIEKLDIFHLICLPTNLLNLEQLKQIKNKNKYELVVGDKCGNCSIIQQKNCNHIENEAIYNFSKYSLYNICPNIGYQSNESIIEDIKFYHKLGFNQFKLDSPAYNHFEKCYPIIEELILKVPKGE